MERETKQFDDTLHSGFIYTNPEGKAEIDYSQSPAPTVDAVQEMSWHIDNNAYRNVTKADGSVWTKEEVLDAISEGHVDAFTINQIRFPPTFEGTWFTEHFPLLFDDRNFGERIGNIVLQGFNREPRV